MSRSDLESCIVAMRGSVMEAKDKLSEHDRKTLLDKSDEVIHWLYKNKSAEGHQCAEKMKELERLATPINSKCGGPHVVQY